MFKLSVQYFYIRSIAFSVREYWETVLLGTVHPGVGSSAPPLAVLPGTKYPAANHGSAVVSGMQKELLELDDLQQERENSSFSF